MTSDAVLFYADHPVEFVEDVIGAKPDTEQAKILRSLAANPMTAVRSGHGIGKSAVQAWAIIWFICTRPYPKIPCTAPTQHQLYDILWAEVSKWLRSNPALQREIIWTQERVYMAGAKEEWFAVARTSNTPDALQGFHSESLLFIIDEASGVDDKVFEPVLGALSTEGARLLMCGNPTQLQGFFYDAFHKNRAEYHTIHVDDRNSPRVSQEYIDRIRTMYGEDSDVFRVRVAGDFPKSEKDVFIPLSMVEKSINTDWKESEKPLSVHIGCDVARFGDDKTVIGYKIDEKIYFHQKIQGQDTVRTAHEIALLGCRLVDKYHLETAIPVKIDDGGVGGGVTDNLRQIKRSDPDRFWWLSIVPVKFGQIIKHKYYHDTTTYMMAVVKKLLQTIDDDGKEKPVELILPDDADLAAQLSTRKYGVTEKSKVKIESKKDVKARGQPSPDEADCVLLLCLPVKPSKAHPPKGAGRKE